MSKIRCDQCSSVIGVDAVIPSEAWATVSRGAYALCVPCLDGRLQEAGIRCPAYLLYRSPALDIDVPDDVARAVMEWRPSQTQVERDGAVGVASLTRDAAAWSAAC